MHERGTRRAFKVGKGKENRPALVAQSGIQNMR
nr:MAG TPA: hypothetical protein [Caudoviricetes sp.]